jgi:hypothetical protein
MKMTTVKAKENKNKQTKNANFELNKLEMFNTDLSASSSITILCRPGGSVTFF